MTIMVRYFDIRRLGVGYHKSVLLGVYAEVVSIYPALPGLYLLRGE